MHPARKSRPARGGFFYARWWPERVDTEAVCGAAGVAAGPAELRAGAPPGEPDGLHLVSIQSPVVRI